MNSIRIRQYNLYLHEQALEEAIQEYSSKGFQVINDTKIGNIDVDLLAIKDDRKIYIEFVLAKRPEPKERILQIKKAVSTIPNAEFRVIYITPPIKKTIEIDDIEQTFYDYLNNDLPSDISDLATHVSIADVSSVEIIDVHVSSGDISIKGYATIEVELQFGSNSDLKHGDGLETVESLRANFEVILNKDLTIEDANFEFDLSDWYNYEP